MVAEMLKKIIQTAGARSQTGIRRRSFQRYCLLLMVFGIFAIGCFPVITAVQDGWNPIGESITSQLDSTKKTLVLPVWTNYSDRCHIRQSFVAEVGELRSAGDRFRRRGVGWWVADGHGVSHSLYLDGVLVIVEDRRVFWAKDRDKPGQRHFSESLITQLIAEVSQGEDLNALIELHLKAPSPLDRDFLSACFVGAKAPRLRSSAEQKMEIVRFLKLAQGQKKSNHL